MLLEIVIIPELEEDGLISEEQKGTTSKLNRNFLILFHWKSLMPREI